MIRVRMLDFLKTGVFAGMALGTNEFTVRRILGEPEGVVGDQLVKTWKYGSLEILYCQGRIHKLTLNYEKGPGSGLKGIEVEGWGPRGSTTIEEMEAVAKREGLPFRQSPETFFDDFLPYEFDSGVTATFLKELGVNWLLNLYLETAPGRFSRA